MKKTTLLSVLILVAMLLVACPAATPEPTPVPPTDTPVPPTDTPVPPTEEPPAVLDGQALVQERCTKCHSLGRVETKEWSEEQWTEVVERMVDRGAELSQEEQAAVIGFLVSDAALNITGACIDSNGGALMV